MLGARDADFDVTIVRGGDDCAVERLAGQQLPIVPVEARAVTFGDGSRRIQRVRDRNDLALGLLVREREMAHTDTARAEQRQSHRIAHRCPPQVVIGTAAFRRGFDRAPSGTPRGLFGFHAPPVKRDLSRCA